MFKDFDGDNSLKALNCSVIEFSGGEYAIDMANRNNLQIG